MLGNEGSTVLTEMPCSELPTPISSGGVRRIFVIVFALICGEEREWFGQVPFIFVNS